MEYTEQTSNTHSAPNQTKKTRKKQVKPETRMISLLEQCKVEMQNVEQRLAEVQTQFEITQLRLHALQAEIAKQYASPPQTDPTPPTHIDSLEETPVTDSVSPTNGLYAYGLVKKSPRQFDIVGIDKKNKVYAVKGRDLCVMVSEINISQFQDQVKNLYAALAQTPGVVQDQDGEILQAHENVIDAIMQFTTIVPLKFGTILKDEQAALKLLDEQGEDFKHLLSKFQSKVECGLKVYADTRVVMQYIMQRDLERTNSQEQQEPLSKGAAYLLARKKEEQLKERVSAELFQVAEQIFDTFRHIAFEMKQNSLLTRKVTGKKKDMILNAVYLVGKEQVISFSEQVKSLTEQYSSLELDLEFSGPWPPYNFM
jgi:hypothetical protein